MRILMFIDSMASGGKERRLVELLKGLQNNPSVECELVVMSHEVHFNEIFDLKIPIHFLLRKTTHDIRIFWKFWRLCRTLKPGAIHVWDKMTAVYALPATVLLNIPLINGMITDAPPRLPVLSKVAFAARLTFPFSNFIVSNSVAGLHSYRVRAGKGRCIHNGFDFQRIAMKLSPREVRVSLGIRTKYVVGMVAGFSPHKDHTALINAGIKLLHGGSDVTFLCIGEGELLDKVRSMINPRWQNRFVFVGRRSDVESLVSAIDVGVLFTNTEVIAEGISNAIMEYMALGKPVVATQCGGTPELVSNGTSGFLVKENDPILIARHIHVLLNDATLRKKMGKVGRRIIEESFSIDQMIKDYISLYVEASA